MSGTLVVKYKPTVDNTIIAIRFNGDSAANYSYGGYRIGTFGAITSDFGSITGNSTIVIGVGSSAGYESVAIVNIRGTICMSFIPVSSNSYSIIIDPADTQVVEQYMGEYRGDGPIKSIDFIATNNVTDFSAYLIV